MTIEELKEVVKPLLSGIVSGEIPENAEDILQNIIDNYPTAPDEPKEPEENEWKAKYDALLKKYTDRFLNGDEQDEQDEPEETTETIDTIFEKEESED